MSPSRRSRGSGRRRSRLLPGYWLRHPFTSLVLSVLAGLTFLLMGYAVYDETRRLNEHGVTAAATVLEVHGGRSSYVVARFSTEDGRIVTAEVHDYYWDPPPKVGDRATLVYDPDAPDTVVRDARMGRDYTMVWVLSALGLILGAGGTVFLARTWAVWRDNAEAWRDGAHGM